jgi:hypothetical protein
VEGIDRSKELLKLCRVERHRVNLAGRGLAVTVAKSCCGYGRSRSLGCQVLRRSGHEALDRLANVAGTGVVDCAGRPTESVDRRRPYPKNRLPAGQVKLKPQREPWMRRTQHVHKKLTDDLRAGLTIVVGSASISPPRDNPIREYKKRRREP